MKRTGRKTALALAGPIVGLRLNRSGKIKAFAVMDETQYFLVDDFSDVHRMESPFADDCFDFRFASAFNDQQHPFL